MPTEITQKWLRKYKVAPKYAEAVKEAILVNDQTDAYSIFSNCFDASNAELAVCKKCKEKEHIILLNKELGRVLLQCLNCKRIVVVKGIERRKSP